MDATAVTFAGAARQAELVRSGEVSARELTEAVLERIARIDPLLNAFRTVLGERAVGEAGQADARRRGGGERPLLGVPVAVKDNHDVAGEVSAHGTGAYGPPARADSELVRRLRAAGAVIVGKTHMPELALWPFTESATWGVTRNPWALDRTPGGSSGGSAAAVAAGLAGLGTASDGAGSIRIPAACCALFGLKPQRDRVSLAPDREHWHGLSAAGALTRTVLDTAVFLDAVAGEGAQPGAFSAAATRPPERLRIAVIHRPPLPARLDDDVRGALNDTSALLRDLGHEVEEVDPGLNLVVVRDVLARYLRGGYDDARRMARPERLERRTREFARLGRLVPARTLARMRASEAERTAGLRALFDRHDVLMTPTLLRPPVEVGRWEGLGAVRTLNGVASEFAPFTGAWNVTGQPAASVPAGFTGDGLPLAVQLVGRPHDEATLLSLAAQLEAERPWADRRPPLD